MGLRSWFKWRGQDILMNIISDIFWPRTSAGVIVIEDRKILCLDLEEYYTLPIGGSDKDEQFEETAKRETLEETGLEVEIEERILEQINSNGGVEVLFTAKKIGGELGGNIIEGEPKWVDIDKLDSQEWRYNRDVHKLIEKAEQV